MLLHSAFRYHCHTCKMVDGIGVCTVCAKVCHAGHDVTYSKFGSFFCDCGDREDGSCRALVRRSPQYNANSAPGAGTSSSSCGIGGANRAGTAPEDLSRGRQRRMEGMQPLSAYGFESILARLAGKETSYPERIILIVFKLSALSVAEAVAPLL